MVLLCCSVALTLYDPLDCTTPVFPAHYQLPELAQIHVHWVGDAIQPPCPLWPPSPPAFDYKYLWKCIKLYPLKSEFYCISSLKKNLSGKKCNSKNIYFKSFFLWALTCSQGFPGGSDSNKAACNEGDPIRCLDQEDLQRKAWLPTPVFLPGEFCGQRSLVSKSWTQLKN